jgi:DNA-binding transcriptional LysR family regulator
VQQLNHAAQRLRGLTTGTIKIGTVLDPSILQVGELLSLAFERHPQLELELHQVLSSEALVGVRNGTLDASFYFGHRPEADLDAVALREIIYRVAIPIAWADELMSAPWEVVAERPWIITPEHSSHRALVMELFHDRSALPARIIEADNEPVIINLVESQVGVSLVREELASTSSKAGRVAVWPGASATTKLWLVHDAKRNADPLLQALLEVLYEIWPGAGKIAVAAPDDA